MFDKFKFLKAQQAFGIFCFTLSAEGSVWILLFEEPHRLTHAAALHSSFSHLPLSFMFGHFQLAPQPKAELLPQDLVPFEIQIPGAISPAQELPYVEQTSFSLAALSLFKWPYSNSPASLFTVQKKPQCMKKAQVSRKCRNIECIFVFLIFHKRLIHQNRLIGSRQ